MTIQDGKAAALFRKASVSADELLESGVLPVSRNSLYDALKSGEIECFRIGRRVLIPTAPLRRKLGLDAA